MANIIFSTTNVYGVNVVLNVGTLNGHIIPNHPEMQDNVDAIRITIESPDTMIQSARNGNRIIYVSQNAISTYPKLYLKTVVDHTNPNEGKVVTSFFEKKLDKSKEGTVIYEKN